MTRKTLSRRLAGCTLALGLITTCIALTPRLAAAAETNVAGGKPMVASSVTQNYVAANASDNNIGTYWESNGFPASLTAQLGADADITSVIVKLNPASIWATRQQRIQILGRAANATSFTSLVASTSYTFDPAANSNTVTIPVSGRVASVQLQIASNTGAPGAQVAELLVMGAWVAGPTPTPTPVPVPVPTDGNLSTGKPVAASSVTQNYIAANANDSNIGTYWESNGFPADLTVQLGANADVTSVVVKLNPDPIWGARQQRIQVLGRAANATSFTSLVPSADYTFDPAGNGNSVTIPVSGRAADVQLQIASNTGAPGAQVAEIEVRGSWAPAPDLVVSGVSWTPTAPVETDAITLAATVRNAGTLASTATTVNLYLGTTKVGSANVGALAAAASATVTASIEARAAGTYVLVAKVDEANTVVESDETNNSYTSPTGLVVRPADTSDLVASVVTWSPGTPVAGNAVSFAVTVRNQGTVATTSGTHGVTVTVLNDSGTALKTLTGSVSGVLAPGASAAPLTLGTWTAANGRYTVRVVLEADANELPSRRADNTSERPLFVGRGANMPYDMLEAEDGTIGGGAAIVGPNRTIGDLAGEASGRRAVTLNTTGAFVQFTTRSSTNTLVTRFSIPDSAGGGGTSSTLNIYVNDVFQKAIPLTSKYAWLYGAEASPGNSPGAGGPRHIYDEANIFLDSTVPAGSRIKLQKDAANGGTFAIDFINTEQVSPVANPDPARYAVPAGFTHADVQAALDKARQDTNLTGVYLPAGTYETAQKFQVYGKAIRMVGAGPWYTRFVGPAAQENTDIGIRADATANGSTFTGFAYFGNYTSRIDGPGKVFDFSNVANMVIDNVWVEHQVCFYWGTNADNSTIRNSRIRDTFADGINMTNGSTNNRISNNDARSTGDDSFALFSAIDAGGSDEVGNVFENLSATLTWRAAGVAVYGGYNNAFRNIYIADTLVYSGITISSLDFGYPMNGFGADPPTTFDNISIVRAGGHFWGAQTFPAIWVFSASKVFQGIRVSNVDIVDPTYSGIMFQTNYVGNQPQFPVKDTIFTNISISGAHKSGDAYDAKSGFGLWANELPEPGQGPAVGTVVFNNLTLKDNAVDIRNTTSTFTITRN